METYKFNGPKNPAYDNTAVLAINKTRTAAVGEEIDLTDAEYEKFSETLKLTKVGGSSKSDDNSETKSSSHTNSTSDGTVTADGSSK